MSLGINVHDEPLTMIRPTCDRLPKRVTNHIGETAKSTHRPKSSGP
jgi:hypothetical protein